MSVSKKGSRKIIVNDIEYRWSVTGNDGYMTVVIWPTCKDDLKLIGTFDYHHEFEQELDERGAYIRSKGQIIITNRVIRVIIESVITEDISKFKGQIDIGKLEDIYDINNALRENISNRNNL